MITLPGITIQDKIYESFHSLVFRGIREADGQALIVKLLKQEYPSPQELIRYKQEYEITHSLNIEGVIKTYGQQNYQRTLVILLEDIGGESLEKWMRQRSEIFCPMPLPIFLKLAIDISNILGRIHAANVIHKNINPGNIVFNPDTGVVKIIDFGIATQFNRTNPTFKSLHGLEGTLAYLSPEQTGRMNRLLDYRSDFYSLGVTFYELLTGQLPFSTTDILALVHSHIAKQPIPPHEVRGAETDDSLAITYTIPKTISDIVMKLMAKNAEDRYQSAWGIKADLERCAQQFAETNRIDSFQLALQDVPHQFQIPQKPYGREAEITALLAAFERVAGEQESRRVDELMNGKVNGHPSTDSPIHPSLHPPISHHELMLVSGYAGIGKSVLVQELYKPITAKHGYFTSGKFDQFQRSIPYSAIVDALQKLVLQLLSEPDEQVQQWRSRLLTALANNGQIIIDVIPEVELIIGRQPSVPEVGPIEAQNRFNWVFQQFMRSLCSKEHPLVIFLDDLQWADFATLKLIELMMLDEQTQYLFLIGAYRDNEVHRTHPLVLTLENLRKQGAALQEIALAPLTLKSLSQLIAETLHQNVEAIYSLAQLVLHKTGGNPFFVNEFLGMLYSENLLSFDTKDLSWQWNIAQIEAQNITDNVVELLLLRLKRLPEVTQQLLQLAACVGTEFNLKTLSLIYKQAPKTIFESLLAAVQAGLIQPLLELDEDLLVQNYKFLHDRVQQAAYGLIDESQRQLVHLQIGHNLLEKTLPVQLSERLFEIVDHLNHAIALVANSTERDEIARLNLIAGQKAKAAIAYNTAQNYLARGRAWLAASSWQTNYQLTLDLYLETTEVAYLCGEFEQVEDWAAIVLEEAKTILDVVKVYEIKIQTYIAQSQPLKAIDTALQVLQRLGISFPVAPTQLDIQLELEAIISQLGDKPIMDLIDLPEIAEPHKLAVIRILPRITIAAQISVPDLVPLLVFKQVNLLIHNGNTFTAPFAYATFGLVLCGMSEDIEYGYQFGQLALKLLSRLDTHSLKARTLYIVNNYIIPRKKHFKETSKQLLEGYQIGLETGDLEFSAYCVHAYCSQSFFVGKELVELEREITIYCEAICQIKQKSVLDWIQIYQQSVLYLRGSISSIGQIGEVFGEKELPSHKVNEATLNLIYLHKIFLCYLFSEYSQAVENSARAESYLSLGRGTLLAPFYYLYSSLARLAIYPESNAQMQEEILKKVALSQEKMKRWAQYAPMNYLHKYYLIEAEKARVLGQWFEAEEFYEQAIQGAKENGYIQEEAVAYELAAKFYLSRGREKFAQTYMKEAHYCYERWGAAAKVNDLETRYPQFFSQSSSVGTSILTYAGTSYNQSSIAFDLAAVLKASQAISREIELHQLLRSLMQILIESAGAQTGFLILENSDEWLIESACELDDGQNIYTIQVLQSIAITDRLPESIIHYVIRTHESIILNDATREGNFIHEPYIQRNQTQSIFCLPLLNQAKLVGVLYLENQLATGAFTPERSQVLHLLSTQAAIAIENAKLYLELRASENRMAQFLEAIPLGVAVVDTAGRPYYFNQRATQLTGKGAITSTTLAQLTDTYQTYIAGTNQKYPTEKLNLFRALKGERTRTDDLEIHRGDTIIPVEIWGTPVFDEQGNVAYAIATFQDITERKQAERLLADYNHTLEQQVAERTSALQRSEATLRDVYDELRLREQELRLITDALPICICYVDANQHYRFVNQTYEDWFKCSRDELIGKHSRELLGSAAYQVAEPYINRALAGQMTTYEAEISYPSGKKYICATFIPDLGCDAEVRGYYGLIRDIRDRKRAEATCILEERNRMAREIHDTLAQSFTGIIIHARAAANKITVDPQKAQDYLIEVQNLARTGLAEARRSVEALRRPYLLENNNLLSAFRQLTTQLESSTETTIKCECIGIPYLLPSEVENNLLRIGQEALTNALKYAKATEIRVELIYQPTKCSLRIKDNGQGFVVNRSLGHGGFGLLGMSERADRIGAQIHIQSAPGRGTEIVVSVNQEKSL